MDERKALRALRRILAASVLAAASLHAAPLELQLAADASFDRNYDWSIEKGLTPQFSDRFVGEMQQVEWTITATRGDPVDSNAMLVGSFSIDNPNAGPVDITSITLTYDGALLSYTGCATGELAGGASLQCEFETSLADPVDGTLLLDVQTAGDEGAATQTQVAFGDPAIGGGSITVEDDFLAEPLVFTESGSHSYTQDVQCTSGNSVYLENTATIVGGDSDTEEGRVSCHVLRMERQAATGGETRWTWDIEKTHAETGSLMLSAGDSYDVDYTITATATAVAGGSNMVTGTVTVFNTHPLVDAELLSVQAFINGTIAADVDCPTMVVPDADYDGGGNVVLGSVVCPFSVAMPAGETASTITARVEQQLYDYAVDGTATPDGTSVLTGTVPVQSGGASAETDECVTISDIYLGTGHDLGQFCASDSPVVLAFTGTITVDAESACEFQVANLARFVTNDTGSSGEDGTLVDVSRPDCITGGCTRTLGYWKTHSSYGPAPYDDTWAGIGEDTAFFSAMASGTQLGWYQVLWTSPRGNAYYILAHQYIAASLNLMAGADASTEVLDALDAATTLFETYTPDQVAAMRGNHAVRAQFIELAELLDRYNNGDASLGSSHCDESTEE